MYNKVFLVCAIIVAVNALPVHIQEHHEPILVLQSHHQPKGHAVSSQSIVSHHTPSKHYEGHHHEHEEYAHPAYKFEYNVHDDHTKDIKSQSEHRDGDAVQGHYSLLQPDGHVRNVHYQADKHSGFNAEVSYSGPSHHY